MIRRALVALAGLGIGIALTWPAEVGCFAPDDPLPTDRNVTVGTLANGLRYYIRANRKPEKRVVLRLVVSAGSVNERDDQQGLAHFVEHMAFNGTANFPKQALTNYLESIGMRFGPEVNGYTSFDNTVYVLEMPIDSAGVLEKGLDILADWASNVTLDDDEIEKERGVVVEEWREGQGAGMRILEKELPFLFKGSKYAERIPIGKLSVLETFKPEILREFYHQWYRPNLMAVVAVGDFDPARIEALVREKFGSIARAADAGPPELYPVPDHDEMLAVVASDKEMPQATVTIYRKLPVEPQKTVGAYRQILVEDLYNRMLNARFLELVRRSDPPVINASSTKSRFIKTKQYAQLSAAVREDRILLGLKTLVTEIERVRRFGFAQSELDRQKEQALRSFEKAYNERDKTESALWAGKYVTSFLYDGPMPGIEYTYDLARQLIPEITLEDVNRVADAWTSEKSNVVAVKAPEKQGLVVPSEGELVAAVREARTEPLDAYEDKVSQEPLIPSPPTASPVASETTTPDLGLVEWRLANGVRVVLKPTQFKNDEVQFWGFSPGGTSLASDDRFVPAWFASTLVGQSGVGSFDFVELRKRLSGRMVSVTPEIDDLAESLRGSASPRDLETMFQLIYLYFTSARLDSATYLSFKSRTEAYLRNRDADPEVAFSDTLALTLTQHHPRTPIFNLAALEKFDLTSSYAFYLDRFADASDFTFVIVGAFEVDRIRPLVETYLGGLPSRGRKEAWRDVGIRPPRGVVKREVRKGQDPRSRVDLTFAGPFEWSHQSSYELGSMADILRIKLREILREDEGAVYSVSVTASSWKLPSAGYDVTISFGCAPERAEELLGTVFAEIDSLSQAQPEAAYVAKVKEAQRRDLEVNLQQNGYWLWMLRYYDFYGLDRKEMLRARERIEGLTGEALQATAARYLRRDNYIQVVLYPAGR